MEIGKYYAFALSPSVIAGTIVSIDKDNNTIQLGDDSVFVKNFISFAALAAGVPATIDACPNAEIDRTGLKFFFPIERQLVHTKFI